MSSSGETQMRQGESKRDRETRRDGAETGKLEEMDKKMG